MKSWKVNLNKLTSRAGSNVDAATENGFDGEAAQTTQGNEVVDAPGTHYLRAGSDHCQSFGGLKSSAGATTKSPIQMGFSRFLSTISSKDKRLSETPPIPSQLDDDPGLAEPLEPLFEIGGNSLSSSSPSNLDSGEDAEEQFNVMDVTFSLPLPAPTVRPKSSNAQPRVMRIPQPEGKGNARPNLDRALGKLILGCTYNQDLHGPPVMAVAVVSSHSIRGPVIKHIYPEEFGQFVSRRTACVDEDESLTHTAHNVWGRRVGNWKDDLKSVLAWIPAMALPDDGRNRWSQYVFFVIPGISGNMVFGVSCILKTDIPDPNDISKTSFLSRKAVCLLSQVPFWGLLECRLEPVSLAYFQQKDHADLAILASAYQQINTSVHFEKFQYAEMCFNLEPNLIPLVLKFRLKQILMILKALLIQSKIIVFSSVASKCSSAVLTLLSFLPGSLTCGFNSDGIGSCHFEWRQYGWPFEIFNEECVLYPFLSLQLLDDLVGKEGFLVGTTSGLVMSYRNLKPDIVVDVDRCSLTIVNKNLKPTLTPTSFELKLLAKALSLALKGGDSVNRPASSRIYQLLSSAGIAAYSSALQRISAASMKDISYSGGESSGTYQKALRSTMCDQIRGISSSTGVSPQSDPIEWLSQQSSASILTPPASPEQLEPVSSRAGTSQDVNKTSVQTPNDQKAGGASDVSPSPLSEAEGDQKNELPTVGKIGKMKTKWIGSTKFRNLTPHRSMEGKLSASLANWQDSVIADASYGATDVGEEMPSYCATSTGNGLAKIRRFIPKKLANRKDHGDNDFASVVVEQPAPQGPRSPAVRRLESGLDFGRFSTADPKHKKSLPQFFKEGCLDWSTKLSAEENTEWQQAADAVRSVFTYYFKSLCEDMAVASGPNRSQLSLQLPVQNTTTVNRYNGDFIRSWVSSHNGFSWLKAHRLPVVRVVSSGPPQYGSATYQYDNGDVYTGSFLSSRRHGSGTYVTKKGVKYEGTWRNDKREGKGVLTDDDSGFMYSGEWLADAKEGEGHFYSRRERYWGQFRNNQFHGLGMYADGKGNQYEGEFKCGQFDGAGKLRLQNGDIYSGEWQQGRLKGIGNRVYTDGRIYAGAVKNDVPHGIQGRMTFTDGSEFEGAWSKGLRHGPGVMTMPAACFADSIRAHLPNVQNHKTESLAKCEHNMSREERHCNPSRSPVESNSLKSSEGNTQDSFQINPRSTLDDCSQNNDYRQCQSTSKTCSPPVEKYDICGMKNSSQAVPQLIENLYALSESARKALAVPMTLEGTWLKDRPCSGRGEWDVRFPNEDKYSGSLKIHEGAELSKRSVVAEDEWSEDENAQGMCQGPHLTERQTTGLSRQATPRSSTRGAFSDTETFAPASEREREKHKGIPSFDQLILLRNDLLTMNGAYAPNELKAFPHGFGISKVRATGETYEGQWCCGTRHGGGESVAPDGSRYSGKWCWGYRHGEGLLVLPDRTVIKGHFEYNRLIKGEIINRPSSIDEQVLANKVASEIDCEANTMLVKDGGVIGMELVLNNKTVSSESSGPNWFKRLPSSDSDGEHMNIRESSSVSRMRGESRRSCDEKLQYQDSLKKPIFFTPFTIYKLSQSPYFLSCSALQEEPDDSDVYTPLHDSSSGNSSSQTLGVDLKATGIQANKLAMDNVALPHSVDSSLSIGVNEGGRSSEQEYRKNDSDNYGDNYSAQKHKDIRCSADVNSHSTKDGTVCVDGKINDQSSKPRHNQDIGSECPADGPHYWTDEGSDYSNQPLRCALPP